MRRSGVTVLLGMVLVSTTDGPPWWAAMVLVALAVVVHSVGEIWQAAAAYELSYTLAAPHAQGQYSGIFGMSTGLSSAAGPPLLAVVCTRWGAQGWLIVGLVFVAVGLVFPRVIQWAGPR